MLPETLLFYFSRPYIWGGDRYKTALDACQAASLMFTYPSHSVIQWDRYLVEPSADTNINLRETKATGEVALCFFKQWMIHGHDS